MTPEQKGQLKEAKTIPEMIKILNTIFDLDRFELPLLAKNILVSNLDTVIDFLKIPLRNGKS